MSDHKAAFVALKYFQRWRSTLTIQYDISRPISDDLALPKVVWPQLKLWEPGVHSRETQAVPSHVSGGSHHWWHIPATDQNAWMCMNIS